MAHDIFISYSTKTDTQKARDLCAALEAANMSCWIAPRDSEGVWPEAINTAISASKVIVLLYSTAASLSPEVAREVTLAADARRQIVPFLLEDIKPEGTFRYFLQNVQWVPGYGDDPEAEMAALASRVAAVLHQSAGGAALPTPMPHLQVRHVPYKDKNTYLVGRDEVLEDLHQAFQQEGLAARKQVIVGSKGIGKKEIARAYDFSHSAEYAAVLWTAAANVADIEAGFLKFARTLRLTGYDGNDDSRTLRSVQEWLGDQTDYLLILADVTAYNHVRTMLPASARGRLLITTDLLEVADADEVTPFPLRRLESAAAVEFLLRRSGRDDDAATRLDAAVLTKVLGGLPLALRLAADYLRSFPTLPLLQHAAALQERKQSLLTQPNGTVDPDIVVAWNANLEGISKNADAKPLLTLSAFLGPTDIPEKLAVKYVRNNAAACVMALDVLQRFSLVSCHPDGGLYDINPIIQEVARNRLHKDTQTAYAYNAVQAVHKLFPAPHPDTWDECERWVPHALACAAHIKSYNIRHREAWQLLYKLSIYLGQRARYGTATPILEMTQEMLSASPGAGMEEKLLIDRYRTQAASARQLADLATDTADPLGTAQELNKLAFDYNIQGRYDEAEPLFKRSLEIHERVQGKEHPDVADSLNNLAVNHSSQGRYDEAEPLFKRSLEIHERVQGKEHPDVARSLNSLAANYNEQGRYNEAEPLLKLALDIRRKALGEEHLDVAWSLNSLAATYNEQGRYDEAEPLLKCALEIYERMLGEEHLDVAWSLNILATNHSSQGRYDEAEPLFKRSLEIHERVQGKEHPDVADSLNNLAMNHSSQGHYDEAESLYKRALDIHRKALGETHPSVAFSLNNMAANCGLQGHYDKAEPLLKRALEIRRRALGEEHPHTSQTWANLEYVQKLLAEEKEQK